MARPSDREFQLGRKIKDLEEQNRRLEIEVAKLKKQIEKSEAAENKDLTKPKKATKIINKPCPDCGAELKMTDLPHAVMELCSSACGFRLVKSKKG